jgi:serine/threonine-protein kinase
MGEVYRAEDLKLGQAVALKFLPREVRRNEARLNRLLNEVKVALKVTHPNVCRVHDIGEVDGQHYLSMEYVDGEDLASLLRRIGRLPEDKAIQIARQRCAGLQGILHRDLKPANVLIDGRGRAKITDFGLAGLGKEIRGAEVTAGTPAYMAPEQLAGREVTVRSDLHSLGSVLYELFTGKRAFDAGTQKGVARRQKESTTSPSSHVEGLDPAVDRVILGCLEPEPQNRPTSALARSRRRSGPNRGDEARPGSRNGGVVRSPLCGWCPVERGDRLEGVRPSGEATGCPGR